MTGLESKSTRGSGNSHGAASQSSLETERINRAEMCLAAATPAGASVRRARRRVARACGCACRRRRGQLSHLHARGRAGPGDACDVCSLPAASVCSASAASAGERCPLTCEEEEAPDRLANSPKGKGGLKLACLDLIYLTHQRPVSEQSERDRS